jgi:ADP-heptose:LPS heptosyltransferase
MTEAVIVRPAALGDTLMLLPALRGMADGVEVTVVGRAPGLDFLKPYTARILNYDRGGWHRLFSDSLEPVPDLPLSGSARTALFLSDPEGRVKQNLAVLFPNQAIKFFPPFPPKGERTHTALYLARCLENAGFPLKPDLAFQAARMGPLVGNRSPQNPGRGVLFHPGSGGREKNYSPQFWILLIKQMEKKALVKKGPFRLLLGPAEKSAVSLFKEHLEPRGVKIDVCPDIDRLIALLEVGALYIGHDSGITHLAAMVGIPTLALFRSSPLHQWHPLGLWVHVLQASGTEVDLFDRVIEEGSRLLRGRKV